MTVGEVRTLPTRLRLLADEVAMSRASLFVGSSKSAGEEEQPPSPHSIPPSVPSTTARDTNTAQHLRFTTDGLLKEGKHSRAKVSPLKSANSAIGSSGPSSGRTGVARVAVLGAAEGGMQQGGMQLGTPSAPEGPEAIEAFYRAA